MLPSSVVFRTTVALAALAATSTAWAVGESENGFPNWGERILHELANRARVDPQLEMDACGAPCLERVCYDVMPPLYYRRELNRAARFHADEMTQQSFFSHPSNCTVVDNIADLYPDQCDGSASCACVGGVSQCSPECTSSGDRVRLFGVSSRGEIIAGGRSPERAFYMWLYEDANGDSECHFTMDNGHRWLLLTHDDGAVGFGVAGEHVGNFGSGGEEHKIASGSHLPRQDVTIEAWANWYDTAGPSSALINIDGECTPMTLTRGVETNGAYSATLSGYDTGCHRYFFLFTDSAGTIFTFPSTGSLGIGPEGSCADWSDERPGTGASCNCVPQCDGVECGDDQCGGSCGACGSDANCEAGVCVSTVGTGGSAGQGGATSGGAPASGGDPGSGGTSATGGAEETGGATASGGAAASGGAQSSGGVPAGTSPDDAASDEGGCSCRAPRGTGPVNAWPLLLVGLLLGRRRRR